MPRDRSRGALRRSCWRTGILSATATATRSHNDADNGSDCGSGVKSAVGNIGPRLVLAGDQIRGHPANTGRVYAADGVASGNQSESSTADPDPRCRMGRVGRALPRPPRVPASPGEEGTPPIGRYRVLMQAATIRRGRRRRWLTCRTDGSWNRRVEGWLLRSLRRSASSTAGPAMRRSLARLPIGYGRRPALAGITGGRRWCAVSTISRVSIPCRYLLGRQVLARQ